MNDKDHFSSPAHITVLLNEAVAGLALKEKVSISMVHLDEVDILV